MNTVFSPKLFNKKYGFSRPKDLTFDTVAEVTIQKRSKCLLFFTVVWLQRGKPLVKERRELGKRYRYLWVVLVVITLQMILASKRRWLGNFVISLGIGLTFTAFRCHHAEKEAKK